MCTDESGGGWIDWAQGGLDGVGVLDPTGVSDAINALIYAGRGQWGNAAISGIAIAPYIGDIGKGGKYAAKGAKALKAVDKAGDIAKYSDEATDFAKWLNKGPGNVGVYNGLNKAGDDVYVGITNNIIRRQGQWGNTFRIKEMTGGLTRNQAKAIEQVIIEQNPHYLNIINSISPSNPNYQQAIDWANYYLGNR